MVTARPAEIRLRMYNVGFGDCFLLTFAYETALASGLDPENARMERHVLFDFGSTIRARSRVTLKRLAKSIAADCGGRLDAIVVTHRHADHMSGFGSKGTAAIIKPLDPLLIARSWTESPRLSANSGQPADGLGLSADSRSDEGYLARLDSGIELAERIVERAKATGESLRTLAKAADAELPNADAVTLLDELSKGRRGEYLFAGRNTRLNDLAPGVEFRVLGPPKPRQWPAVANQAANSDEYWLGAGPQVGRLFSQPPVSPATPVGTAQWILERLRQDDSRQVATLVRWLDEALNNTSVILLVSVGNHRLLFGGDAQIENWGWTLNEIRDDKALRDALRSVDLYKVGHHGSRNGTPKSLYELWSKRMTPQKLVSMMSTKAGVHGLDDHAVPRKPLVDALRLLGPVHSTDDGLADWIEVKASVPEGAFQVKIAPGLAIRRLSQSPTRAPGSDVAAAGCLVGTFGGTFGTVARARE